MRAYVESQELDAVPYGRDWQELLNDEDFTRMLQNPMSAIPQAVEYVEQVVAEKVATLVSLAEGADLLVAGMTEQTPAGNVAEYYRIPLAALHFFPPQILQHGSSAATRRRRNRIERSAGRWAYRRNPLADNRWRFRRTTKSAYLGWRPDGRIAPIDGLSSGR